ncbi:MAG: hypothetical protein V2A76_00635 [Planctomycetota bacterium]
MPSRVVDPRGQVSLRALEPISEVDSAADATEREVAAVTSDDKSESATRRFVHARVVTLPGEMVEGAEVTVMMQDRRVGREQSGADGTCSIEVPPFVDPPLVLEASHGEARSGGVTALVEENVTLVLRPVQTLRFLVVDDETGEPVEGCAIQVSPPSWWTHYMGNQVQGRTAGDGTCSVAVPIPLGRILITHPSYRMRSIGDPTHVLPAELPLVVRLAPCPLVRVRRFWDASSASSARKT